MNSVNYKFLDVSQYVFVYCMLLISFIPLAAIARSKDTADKDCCGFKLQYEAGHDDSCFWYLSW